jgi:hypothetical protein
MELEKVETTLEVADSFRKGTLEALFDHHQLVMMWKS